MNKKKIIAVIGAVVIAVVVAFNLNISLSSNVEYDLTLSNVEALGQGEIVIGYFCVVSTPSLCIYPPCPEDPYWYITDGYLTI